MSAAQTCTRGHRSALVRPDGVLTLQGREYARYRCQEPDGSFHRFTVPAAEAAVVAPGVHPNGDETTVMPPLVARLVARAAVQRPGPRPVPALPEHPGLLPSADLWTADTVVFDPVELQDPPSGPAIDRGQSTEHASAERTPPVVEWPAPASDEGKCWYSGARNRWLRRRRSA